MGDLDHSRLRNSSGCLRKRQLPERLSPHSLGERGKKSNRPGCQVTIQRDFTFWVRFSEHLSSAQKDKVQRLAPVRFLNAVEIALQIRLLNDSALRLMTRSNRPFPDFKWHQCYQYCHCFIVFAQHFSGRKQNGQCKEATSVHCGIVRINISSLCPPRYPSM